MKELEDFSKTTQWSLHTSKVLLSSPVTQVVSKDQASGVSVS
jgi:hypothetical protein